MGRITKEESGGEFAQPEAGAHVARSFRIIDIGTQHGEYQGKPIARNQFILQWELPDQTIEVDGMDAPMVISKFYTNSLNEKANLRRDLETWRMRKFNPAELMGFDLMNILDKPCMLSIIHNDQGKARVQSVSAMPKGMQCPPAHNKVEAFWIDEWDPVQFDALADGFKRIIMQSDEYKTRFGKGDTGSAKSGGKTNDFDSDIPF